MAQEMFVRVRNNLFFVGGACLVTRRFFDKSRVGYHHRVHLYAICCIQKGGYNIIYIPERLASFELCLVD